MATPDACLFLSDFVRTLLLKKLPDHPVRTKTLFGQCPCFFVRTGCPFSHKKYPKEAKTASFFILGLEKNMAVGDQLVLMT